MAPDYVVEDLPGETITVNGKTWEREKFHTDSYESDVLEPSGRLLQEV